MGFDKPKRLQCAHGCVVQRIDVSCELVDVMRRKKVRNNCGRGFCDNAHSPRIRVQDEAVFVFAMHAALTDDPTIEFNDEIDEARCGFFQLPIDFLLCFLRRRMRWR